jgi:hypothetical protein
MGWFLTALLLFSTADQLSAVPFIHQLHVDVDGVSTGRTSSGAGYLNLNLAAMGGVGDGTTSNTKLINKAIQRIAAQGGGTLTVPGSESAESRFLTGPFNLTSNMVCRTHTHTTHTHTTSLSLSLSLFLSLPPSPSLDHSTSVVAIDSPMCGQSGS